MTMNMRGQRMRIVILLCTGLGLMAGCAVMEDVKAGKLPPLLPTNYSPSSQSSVSPAGATNNYPPVAAADLNKMKDLHALDASLTLVDMLMSMLRINHLLFERIQISADAEWPDRLDLSKDESEPHYLTRLEEQARKDFSYLNNVGQADLSPRDGVMRWFRGVLLNKELELVAWRVEHQRGTIDSVPHYCDESDGAAAAQRPSPQCETILTQRNQKCPFFAEALEDQLFSFMVQKNLDAWVETPVKDSCLIQATATENRLHPNFYTAFASLLPRHLSRDITRVERDLRQLAQKRGQIEARIEDKKLKKQTLSDQASIAETDREINALKAELGALKPEVKRARATQEKLYQEAMASAEGTPENIRLATQLFKVARVASSNLKLVGGDASLVLANVGEIASKWASSPKDYFTAALAQGYDQQRFDKLVKRSFTLAPNTVNLAVRIQDQSSTVNQQMKYLNKLMRIKALNAKSN